jgi:hypothetical protein
MNLVLDLNVIVQGASVLVLAGVGRVVWSTSIAIAKLGEQMGQHEKQDVERFAMLHEDVKEAASVAQAALYHRGSPL